MIKESVGVKSDAFEGLFRPYGVDVAQRVRRHHEANGGTSRFLKVPQYLEWAGETPSPERVAWFCERFGGMVRRGVIESAWVPGAREYLVAHHADQPFVLVTATPQAEIDEILAELKIAHCFRETYGAPVPKADAIAGVLARWSVQADHALMIGDSDADLRAAQANGVPFLLRRTPLNRSLQDHHGGRSIDDFTQFTNA